MWHNVKGFEDRYEISDDFVLRRKKFSVTQTVKNKTYNRTFCEKILPEPKIDNEGYYYVNLNSSRVRLHWIIYNTFIGDSTGYFIDHIDRNKLNNKLSNLRLATPKLSVSNRTLPYKPDIQNLTNCKQKGKYRAYPAGRPYLLRFSENGKRKSVGYYNTYEEAENKYRELYNERQKRIDDEYITNN